ncbi:unnamed protein product [Ectocarpus sp. 8 AP-2014]
MLSSRPKLEEARLAAALIGMDLAFGLGITSSGLWCNGGTCVGSKCTVGDLLDEDTMASLGSAPSCAWTDETTATVVFGEGYSLGEQSVITLNPSGEYLAGCNSCTEYATGSVVLQGRMLPPELSSARFSDTGQQVFVYFEGSDSSREVNGNYAPVACEEVFSNTSAVTLGIGCTSQFATASTLAITLGYHFTIRPSSFSNCTDGDGTSLSLLGGVVRTEIEAFLSSEPGCVAVGPGLNPNEPVVEISAPKVVGCCSNLILEGFASYPSTDIELNWTIEATDGNGTFDLTDARAVFEQAAAAKDFVIKLPSTSLDEGSTYTFGLRVESALGVSGEASIEVFKSAEALPALKIAGSASRKHWRGLQLTIRTEVSLPRVENGNNTYAWTVLSESSATADFPPLVLTSGRNPSVLTLPPYSLGYAGSAYVFRVDLADGIQSATSATATEVEVVSGAIIAYIAGGTARRLGASQTLYLNASESVDDDQVDQLPFEFRWNCTDEAGAVCQSRSAASLDFDSFASGGLLIVPADTLPIGVHYRFGVSIWKGELDTGDLSEVRSDQTACTISTFAESIPNVSISPKTILRKYNPSEKIVLYACASSSPEGPCDSSTSSSFGLTWRQENGNLDLRNEWSEAFSTPVNARTLVTRKGALGAGQVYSFSLSATDASGLVGYAEFSFETNAPPSGGHLKSDRFSATAGVNPVVLQTLGWTDDIDDLPLTYTFGYIQGYHEVIAIASESALVNRLSSSPSVSTTLSTNVPAGLSRNEFNLTIVVSASDTLGSMAATNLGEDGAPMVVTSVAPEEASLLPLAYNLTCYPDESSCQNGSLPYPEDTLRDARVATALLQHVPLTTLDGVEATSSLQEIGSSTESTLSEASRAAADMVDRVANHGAVLDDAAAVSLVSVTSTLFDGLSASPTTSNEGAAFAENGDQLALLADVGNALAFGSEAEEELGETSAGSLIVQPAKVHSMDISATTISVGPNGTHISFSSWDAAIGSDQDFGGTRTFSVASFSSTGSVVDGVTVVDAWDSAGVPDKQFSWPIDLSMAIPEPDAVDLGADIDKDDIGYLGCGYWSEESGSWETDGVVLGSLGWDLDSTAAVIQCATYHLTAFTSRVDSTTPQWNTLDLVTDFTILAQYGAESWAGLLFLSCVVAALLIPAAWFSRKDTKPGRHRDGIEALWSTYLARGRSGRETRPMKNRVRDRAQAARQALMEDRAHERDGNVFHRMPVVFKNEKNMSKVAAESVLFNHSWRHLSESPTAHFSKTLLTRSQHLVLLLADWMSAILLQAIFYGKSQFGVRQKVEMTVVSALLMLPTGVIFPALLRAGNTPPASQTLKRVPVRQEEPEGPNHDLYDELQRKQEERVDDFRTALQDARSNAREQMHRGGFSAPRDSPPRKTAPTRFVANVRRSPNELYFSATNATPVVQTAAYRDVVAMQKTLLLVYLPLPMLLAMLVSEVLRISREAEAAGGDEYAFLHNMVTSLSVACSVLCALSAFAVVSRSARIMVQTTTFQAVVAPGLALCGVLLYNSSASIAAGAVLGAAVALVGSYLVGVQRKYEDILNELIEGDLIAAWSQPTREMHKAAEIVQRCYRTHHASVRMTRALEFHTWLHGCRRQRRGMQVLASGALYITILCLIYTNMVFAIKFDRTTSTDWLATCVLALLVEAFIQQPASLLVTGVLGDFIEQGADLLLEVM